MVRLLSLLPIALAAASCSQEPDAATLQADAAAEAAAKEAEGPSPLDLYEPGEKEDAPAGASAPEGQAARASAGPSSAPR